MKVAALRQLIFPALAAVAFSLAGCQSQYSFPAPDAHWRTMTGQLRYVTSQRSVIGDCVISSLGDKEFQLDFLAGPGFPLMKLRVEGDNGRAEGVFARGTWQGTLGQAPERLKSWLALREIIVAAQRSTGPARLQSRDFWNAKVSTGGGGNREIEAQFVRSNMPRRSVWLERFVFHFNH